MLEVLSHLVFLFVRSLPETNNSPIRVSELMFGRLFSFWVPAYFQGGAVSFWECISYWKWGYSIAILVYRRVSHLLVFFFIPYFKSFPPLFNGEKIAVSRGIKRRSSTLKPHCCSKVSFCGFKLSPCNHPAFFSNRSGGNVYRVET